MTRKDYTLLTDVLKGRRENIKHLDKLGWNSQEIVVANDILDDVVVFLADALAQDNKAFDKDKFINDIRGL